MKAKKVILVVGARPNFMKIAPIMRAIGNYPKHFKPILVHTGQHYDYEMSKVFFKDLKIPKPNIYLGIGSGTHSDQTGRIMIEFEKVLINKNPDLVVVVGDVNSTVAAALASVKLHIPVAHIEAGLRSFDRRMPEEINRLLTDHISEYLFSTCEEANMNLLKEGIDKKKIFFVGDVMIDTLKCELTKLKSEGFSLTSARARRLKAKEERDYAVLTLHRPDNVDDEKALKKIFKALKEISRHISIIFPAHPRTIKQMRMFGLVSNYSNIRIIEPLGYRDFLKLYMNSKFVLTDSGGIQEETTYLNIPCLTLRENTERPFTLKDGTNTLVGYDTDKIIYEAHKILNGKGKKRSKQMKLWDGKTAERIVKILRDKFVL